MAVLLVQFPYTGARARALPPAFDAASRTKDDRLPHAGVAAFRVAAGHAFHRLGLAALVALVIVARAPAALFAVPVLDGLLFLLLALFHGQVSFSEAIACKSQARAVNER